MRAFLPSTFVPGAFLPRDPLGRPMDWIMPKPVRKVRHFKSMVHRRRHERGEMGLAAATREVPVYAGVGARLANKLRAAARKTERKSTLKRIQEALESALRRDAETKPVGWGGGGGQDQGSLR